VTPGYVFAHASPGITGPVRPIRHSSDVPRSRAIDIDHCLTAIQVGRCRKANRRSAAGVIVSRCLSVSGVSYLVEKTSLKVGLSVICQIQITPC